MASSAAKLSMQDFRPTRKNEAKDRIQDILVERGHVSPDDMFKAISLQQFENANLGELLQGLGYVREDTLLEAASEQSALPIIDLQIDPPSRLLSTLVDPTISLKHSFVVWKHIDDVLVVALSDPHDIEIIRPLVQEFGTSIEFVLAPKSAIVHYHETVHRDTLSKAANQYVPADLSCRKWTGRKPRIVGFSLLFGFCAAAFFAPVLLINVMFGWILVALIANGGFKAAMLYSQSKNNPKSGKNRRPEKLPKITVLLPLLREKDIVDRLIKRMSRLRYPKELLEICLIYEEDDTATKSHLAARPLPYWMKSIEVPKDGLQTKPRAMNYALDFCSGDLIGIYDAEDAPEPDQIYRVAQRFDTADENVACVQCQLDFYNSATNWIARCFTIEYSILFRVILPGLERLRLPIPLGGTSVFFRRDVLEKIGRWDAQNVTEDADLGVRLHRLGYRCLWADATTYEEANFRVLPWVRQRSRWIKGFLLTWVTHMRHPFKLLKDLGPVGFLVVQVQMIGTFSSFAAVPIVLPMWLYTVGLETSIYNSINVWLFTALIISFVVTEIFLLVLGIMAVQKRGGGNLYAFVPAMLLYWPLGAFASYKALWELFVHPTYWDKTEHGINDTHYQAEIERLTASPVESENRYIPSSSMTIGG